jgi:hypothetical protein
MSDTSASKWLPPSSITPSPSGYIRAGDPQPYTFTFADVVNEAFPRTPLPRRIPEVRNALALHLRYTSDPAFAGRGPWAPTAQRYRPFRSIITPLLEHPLWQTATVLAAPFILHLERPRCAGSVDAILELADRTIAIAALYCARPEERYLEPVRAELGGFIASICDQRLLTPSHAIAIWAAADTTTIDYHHPDRCLGLWVDAAAAAKNRAMIRNGGRT